MHKEPNEPSVDLLSAKEPKSRPGTLKKNLAPDSNQECRKVLESRPHISDDNLVLETTTESIQDISDHNHVVGGATERRSGKYDDKLSFVEKVENSPDEHGESFLVNDTKIQSSIGKESIVSTLNADCNSEAMCKISAEPIAATQYHIKNRPEVLKSNNKINIAEDLKKCEQSSNVDSDDVGFDDLKMEIEKVLVELEYSEKSVGNNSSDLEIFNSDDTTSADGKCTESGAENTANVTKEDAEVYNALNKVAVGQPAARDDQSDNNVIAATGSIQKNDKPSSPKQHDYEIRYSIGKSSITDRCDAAKDASENPQNQAGKQASISKV